VLKFVSIITKLNILMCKLYRPLPPSQIKLHYQRFVPHTLILSAETCINIPILFLCKKYISEE
jgi:hypothetical protein